MVHAERYGGIIEHACDLSGRIGKLLFDDSSSDVTLVVEGESLPAHRAILGASSEYFRALLLGETKESTQSEVVLKGVPVRGFKMLMKYIYTGRVELEGIDDTIVLESIELANLYGFEELQLILCAHLVTILSVDNFCVIFETAHRLQFKKLIDACRSYTVGRQLAILQSDAFCELSGSAVIEMISDDSFSVEEIEIFAAVARWCAKRPAGTECSDVLGSVRLPLIGITDLLSTVMESGLIAREVILDAVRTKKSQPANLNFRALILPGVNLADPNAGACRLKQDRSEISDKINPSYEFEPLPSWPLPISFNLKEGLIVALKEPYFINRIDFRIPDGVRIAYEIEVSVDLMIWTRVIDLRRYLCGRHQELYFEPRAARFIRLRGRRDVNFQILALTVFYAATISPDFINEWAFLPNNIALEARGTLFGFERNKEGSEDKVFIRADTTEWMTHEIGVDCILIMFPRPYIVNSLQMLLVENDSRAYKYYIETSEGTRDWKRVADNTANFCRSWQRVTFDAHPVLFIRIVGTASSVDKYFSFSRFECPAPAEVGAKCLTWKKSD